ncbi:hypothetical protein JAAARDRAFT_198718 [Jaapia argillacea MUCL 33604]|uniref:Uncharacterized protein n=1 Tax=Jaapia argillacea MUCL 33604 TaxID=933084 RepID=A0A067PLE2_9AGAM|nr:hypothetical protein JAAARDRAFT_198718 [Jaapia argillacea MUCL 33604]
MSSDQPPPPLARSQTRNASDGNMTHTPAASSQPNILVHTNARSRSTSERPRWPSDRALPPIPATPQYMGGRDTSNNTLVSSPVASGLSPRGSMSAREEGEKPVDDWVVRLPQGKLIRRFCRVACLLGMGTSSMDRLKEITAEGNEAHWKEFKDAMFNRVANVNVVSSLILATTAAFLTTTPPSPIAPWLNPMPYVTLLAAFCLGFVGVGCGTFLLFVLSDSRASSFRELAQTPWKFWAAMWLLASPSLFVGAAGCSGIVALCGAVWFGDSTFAKAGLTITCTLTGLTVFTFCAIVF